eukprot:scaffold13628_cov101-Skeletonema_marinoi.AAC.3
MKQNKCHQRLLCSVASCRERRRRKQKKELTKQAELEHKSEDVACEGSERGDRGYMYLTEARIST